MRILMRHYKEFEDWFYEVEITGTRQDRFYDEYLSHMPDDSLMNWLKAAWECARMEKNE